MIKIEKLKFKIKSLPKGFTLIELLVVMSIIAILALISLFALRGARESARDAGRKSDLEQLKSAFEIYKSDCRYYPNTKPNPPSSLLGNSPPCTLGSGNVYIQSVPDDTNPARDYIYVPTPSGCSASGTCTGYRLWAALEVNPTPTPASFCGSAPSCGGVNCNYCISNP